LPAVSPWGAALAPTGTLTVVAHGNLPTRCWGQTAQGSDLPAPPRALPPAWAPGWHSHGVGWGQGRARARITPCTMDLPGGRAWSPPQPTVPGQLSWSLRARGKLSHNPVRNTDLLQHQFATSTQPPPAATLDPCGCPEPPGISLRSAGWSLGAQTHPPASRQARWSCSLGSCSTEEGTEAGFRVLHRCKPPAGISEQL